MGNPFLVNDKHKDDKNIYHTIIIVTAVVF